MLLKVKLFHIKKRRKLKKRQKINKTKITLKLVLMHKFQTLNLRMLKKKTREIMKINSRKRSSKKNQFNFNKGFLKSKNKKD